MYSFLVHSGNPRLGRTWANETLYIGTIHHGLDYDNDETDISESHEDDSETSDEYQDEDHWGEVSINPSAKDDPNENFDDGDNSQFNDKQWWRW